MNRFPSTIAVNGKGFAALFGAIALKRAYPHAAVTIDTGATRFQADYPGAATPYLKLFHRQIGLDDAVFARRTGARVAHHIDWQAGRNPAAKLVALSTIPYSDGVALHHIWRWADEKSRPLWSDIVQKYQPATDRVEGHGIRFNAAAYLQLLTEMAMHLKIGFGADHAAQMDSYDLVIETQRPGGIGGAAFYRAAHNENQKPDCDHISVQDGAAKWSTAHWSIAYSSEPAAWVADAGWIGNQLRIGHAAIAVECFDGQALCAAMADVCRAISLMPATPHQRAEVAEYNRRTAMIHGMLADWHAFKWGSPPPTGLQHVLQQFGHRGRVPYRDEDPVASAEWVNWLLALGTVPRTADLTASSLDAEKITHILNID